MTALWVIAVVAVYFMAHDLAARGWHAYGAWAHHRAAVEAQRAHAIECARDARAAAEKLSDFLARDDVTLEDLQAKYLEVQHPLERLLRTELGGVPRDEETLRLYLWEKVKGAEQHAYEHEQEDHDG